MGRRAGSDDFDDDFDDFALEVSDLRTGRVVDMRLTSYEEVTPLASDEIDDELTVTSLGVGASGAARRRARPSVSPRARGIVVIGLALVLCLAIFLNLPGMHLGLIEAFQPATPTALVPIGPGGDVVSFVDGVPWGMLTIDGKPIAFAGSGTSATLARGRHQVRFAAAPFATVRCTVSVPADQQRDTCPLLTEDGTLGTTLGTTNDQRYERFITLGETPNTLPSDAYNSLVDEVSSALTALPIVSHVAEGDHYLGANGSSIASTPLVASLTLDLNIDASRPFPDGPPDSSCVSFCTEFSVSGGLDWTFEAHVLARWHFATGDGAAVASADTVTDTSFALSARWQDGRWTLEPFMASEVLTNFCGDALFGSPDDPTAINSTGPSYEFGGEAPSVVEGCAVIISASDDVNDRSPLAGDAALYIYRYGVILAGNDLAHRQQPTFPLATDHERALALLWLDTSP